jgi:uncharacterized protein YbjT (DUF2867 family)
MEKKTALIVGSTGMIGKLLTDRLLRDNFYAEVKTLVRKPSGISHPKLKEVVVDFDNLDDSIIVGDHVFCTLGTTIKTAGSKDNFRKVDFHYPLKVANAAKANGATFYGIVTAIGADNNSWIFYNQVKGEIENALKAVDFQSLGIFQPSMLLGDRNEERSGESIGQKVMLGLNFAIPKNYKAIEGDKVAAAMQKMAKNEPTGVKTVESGEMY